MGNGSRIITVSRVVEVSPFRARLVVDKSGQWATHSLLNLLAPLLGYSHFSIAIQHPKNDELTQEIRIEKSRV